MENVAIRLITTLSVGILLSLQTFYKNKFSTTKGLFTNINHLIFLNNQIFRISAFFLSSFKKTAEFCGKLEKTTCLFLEAFRSKTTLETSEGVHVFILAYVLHIETNTN